MCLCVYYNGQIKSCTESCEALNATRKARRDGLFVCVLYMYLSTWMRFAMSESYKTSQEHVWVIFYSPQNHSKYIFRKKIKSDNMGVDLDACVCRGCKGCLRSCRCDTDRKCIIQKETGCSGPSQTG